MEGIWIKIHYSCKSFTLIIWMVAFDYLPKLIRYNQKRLKSHHFDLVSFLPKTEK